MGILFRPSGVVRLLPIALSLATFALADDNQTAKFVVVAPHSGANAQLGASLYRVLIGSGQRAKFERVETIEQAVASKADVIVLAMASRNLPPIGKETLESLRKRKIVGIGYGSATLFGQLGMQINHGECAVGTSLPASLMITTSELLGSPKTNEAMLVMKETVAVVPRVGEDGERIHDLFAVFLPASETETPDIDVIARWSSETNYAPIVRQGNCVLIGIASPATEWTKSYSGLVGEICMALHQRKLEEFFTIRRELTKPGKYEFELAPCQSADKPFVKDFYFQFSHPTKLRAELDHSGSGAVMLLAGKDRQDAFKGEPLTIEQDITAEDIAQIGDRYWVLNVTNFDRKAAVTCKLIISAEEL